jgi:hypothetical protein
MVTLLDFSATKNPIFGDFSKNIEFATKNFF